jgi:alpha-methylacyl-CoA racemase
VSGQEQNVEAASASISRGPLKGTRVIELAGLGPVPFCAMLLADMGAEILCIAPPLSNTSLPSSAPSDLVQRGRTRLAIDLKQSRPRAALLAALAHTDVLLEGFRPGVLERLELGPRECLAANPRLVIGRMTGWGQSGPFAATPGHDSNYLALTGALHAIGYAGQPPCPPLNLVADLGGGALYLGLGVLAALLHVRSGGRGQVVDAAMVDGAASLMTMIYELYGRGLWSDERGENLLDGGAPFGATYETADGKYLAVCALEPRFFSALLAGLGLDERTLPPQHDRASWPLLRERLAAAFKTRTRDEWARLLEHTDACVTPVLSMAEAPEHPHNRARQVFVGDTAKMPAAAPRFSATPTAHAPAVGPPAAQLLARWGVDTATVAALTE